MSYQIQYSPENRGKYPMMGVGKPFRWKVLLCAGILLTAGLWIKVNGVPDFAIPGDPQITRAAASSFMHQLRNGAGMEEAITVFCRQVLDGAEE